MRNWFFFESYCKCHNYCKKWKKYFSYVSWLFLKTQKMVLIFWQTFFMIFLLKMFHLPESPIIWNSLAPIMVDSLLDFRRLFLLHLCLPQHTTLHVSRFQHWRAAAAAVAASPPPNKSMPTPPFCSCQTAPPPLYCPSPLSAPFYFIIHTQDATTLLSM